jgi:hypothetical protein
MRCICVARNAVFPAKAGPTGMYPCTTLGFRFSHPFSNFQLR